MKTARRAALVLSTLALAASLAPRLALAQAWPDKPIRIVVGFPPGGAADQIARLVGQPLQEVLGQPVVVENRTGAGGNVAGDAVAKSAPDGYTLLMSSGGMVSVNPHIYPKMTFDPAKDLTPVAAAARVSVYLVVRPDFPAKNVQEFLAYAKANPGKLNLASTGTGTSVHLSGEMFMMMTDTKMTHVPYQGAAPAKSDLIAGRTHVIFDNIVSSVQHVRAGHLKALAVTTTQRSRLLPDVPSLSETVPGFEASAIFGMGAPKNTPKEIIEKLNKEINAVLEEPAINAKLVELDAQLMIGTPEDFGKVIVVETDKWAKVVKATGVQLD